MTGAGPIRQRPCSNQRGATLIESVVALGLFAIVAAGMSSFLTHQVRASSTNYLETVAYGLASEALESARTENYVDILPTSSTHREGAIAFTVSTDVKADTPEPNLKTVTATVVWNEFDGQHRVVVPTVYTEVRIF